MSTNDEGKKLSETLEDQIEKSKRQSKILESEDEIKRIEGLIQKRKEYAETLENEFEMLQNIGMAGADLARVKKEQQDVEDQIANTYQVMLEARKSGDEETAKQFEKEIDQANERLKVLSQVAEAQENYKKNLSDIAKEERNLRIESGKLEDEFEKIKKTGIGGFLEDAFGSAPGFLGDIYRQAGKLRSAFAKLGLELAKFAESGSLIAKILGPALSKIAEKLVSLGTLELSALFLPATYLLATFQLIRMGVQLDNLSKKIGAATGFGDKFSDSILKMTKQGIRSGIGMEESANAITAMTNGLSSFNPNAEKTNENLGLTIARLEKLGVSSADTVKSIDHLQRAMKMTAEQAADVTAQVARMGKEIGITGTKMLSDFNAASARLSIYGERNIEVFKGLAAMAKASGIEISNLVSISEKFDKFDSAADSIAQLNAVLGTQLSTMEMLAADDDERIMMIKQQVQASVGNFDSLDKHTKMYIAQAMGVNSVADAQRILNMSMAEYQSMEEGQREQARIQEEIAKATEDLVPMFQKLKLAFTEALLAFSPILTIVANLTPIIAGLAKGITYLVGSLAVFLPFIISLGKALGFFATGVLSVGNPLGWLVVGITTLVLALQGLFDIFHLSGSPMLYQMFDFIAGAVGRLAAALTAPVAMVRGLADSFVSMFSSLHNQDASKSFDIAAVANLDLDSVSAGINKVKSALVELSNIEVSGLVAMTTDGTNTSLIMGSVATEMAMLLGGGKLSVDVSIPEIKTPDVHVKVYIGDTELRNIIRTEVSTMVGGAG
jgi:hypothetical protein